MPTENVLIQITTAANLAGIEQAQKGLLGLSATTVGLAAVLFAVITVGKAGIENYKAQEEATNLLTQAYATQKDTLAAHKAQIEAFLATNAAFIKDQYDVQAALANVVRAGLNPGIEAYRVLNDALDLSAIKHISVAEAARILTLAEAGNSRGLRDLGITTDQYNAIMKSTMTTEQKHAALLDLIEQRTAKGRDTIDQTTQSQNKLTIAWQDFTSKTGPSLLTMWQKLNEAAATGIGLLSVTVDLLNKLAAIGPFGGGGSSAPVNTRGFIPGRGTRASGGPVQAGEAYTVGEQGPETLVMGDQGGSIVPHGGGGNTVIVHIHGAVLDGPALDRFFNEGLRRARFAPGT